jgi:WD40 repeat protein
MDIETGSISKITNGDFNYDANWFPDGKQILYYYTNHETEFLRVVHLDSTKNCEFEIRNIGPISDISLSPNGRYIAYQSYTKVKILDLSLTELGEDYLDIERYCVNNER